ncbi:MAG: hypothetical protein DMF69_24885 [Acidobacteria bacterium]|nr:MAG: hypothetical protein DMF69_24885 [Acidobacteriota bacterium]
MFLAMNPFLSVVLILLLGLFSPLPSQSRPNYEYLWYEAENMRGFSTGKLGEPLLNPSYLNLSRDKAPGWGINGPGVSAEWTQGGESEWNSAAASADETSASLSQDLEIPRDGRYTLWVRYADWANKEENFVARVAQNGRQVFEHEYGVRDVIDPHDEVSMYWQWAFAWDSATVDLKKGPARLSIDIAKAAPVRRNVDCFVLTNDQSYKPVGRQKPDFAAQRYLHSWSTSRKPIASLVPASTTATLPEAWLRPKISGRDFLMPWNTAKEFWAEYDKPTSERILYPFNAEPIDLFINKYKSVKDSRGLH